MARLQNCIAGAQFKNHAHGRRSPLKFEHLPLQTEIEKASTPEPVLFVTTVLMISITIVVSIVIIITIIIIIGA